MKNSHLKLPLLVALFVAFSSLKAREPYSDTENPFTKKIQNLKAPAALLKENKQEKIKIYFSVDEKGNVKDIFIDSNDKEIKKDLTQQFMQLNFSGLNPCVMNSIVLNFILY